MTPWCSAETYRSTYSPGMWRNMCGQTRLADGSAQKAENIESAIAPPGQEGWMRRSKKDAKHPLSRRRGGGSGNSFDFGTTTPAFGHPSQGSRPVSALFSVQPKLGLLPYCYRAGRQDGSGYSCPGGAIASRSTLCAKPSLTEQGYNPRLDFAVHLQCSGFLRRRIANG